MSSRNRRQRKRQRQQNGQSNSAETVKQERERQREFQRDLKREQQAMQEAFNADGQLSRGWMREILDTDDLEDRLQKHTIHKIQGMLNKQWMLSNLTEAETHDVKFKLEVMKYKIYGEHPPPESGIVGPLRAFLYDDEREDLAPLTSQERNTIDQIIISLQNMVRRSRGGFERKQINTDIARTESDDMTEEDGSGAISGLFG
jgi:hypothetical protein